MDKTTSYGVSISYPLEINKNWTLVGFGDAAYQTFAGNLEGTLIDITAKTWSLRFQNSVKLPWDLAFDLTYAVASNWIWRGSIELRGNHDVGFGLKKAFLDKRLEVRITGADIFRTTNNYFYNGNYGGLAIDGVRTFDSQRFGVGATLKFGNLKAKGARKVKGALDDELRRIDN
jgi:hypothetical protein